MEVQFYRRRRYQAVLGYLLGCDVFRNTVNRECGVNRYEYTSLVDPEQVVKDALQEMIAHDIRMVVVLTPRRIKLL